MISDDAVMGHVHVSEQPVVIANARRARARAAASAAIHGGELADDVPVADHELGMFAGELLVLRIAANRAMRHEPVVATDGGGTGKRAVRPDLAAIAHLHASADDAEGADPHVRAQPGAGIDHGGWMHLR